MNKKEINLCLEKLDKISKLENNWDLYEAEEINKDLIDIMTKLIYELDYIPEIFPTPSGSIQFEYDNEEGDYLEFELIDNKTIEIFRLNWDDKEEYDTCGIDSKIINLKLKDFFSKE